MAIQEGSMTSPHFQFCNFVPAFSVLAFSVVQQRPSQVFDLAYREDQTMTDETETIITMVGLSLYGAGVT